MRLLACCGSISGRFPAGQSSENPRGFACVGEEEAVVSGPHVGLLFGD